MHTIELITWAGRLERLADATLPRADLGLFIRSPALFRDEAGSTREIDPALLRHLGLRLGLQSQPTADQPVPLQPLLGRSPDATLWHALTDPLINPDAVLDPSQAHGPRPLLLQPAGTAIEVRTESELAALHALWWLASLRNRPDWGLRIDTAASWLLEHLQPDNATNHAWSVHVFIHRALHRRDDAAMHFAQTLLHNCQIATGRPDRFSALLLWDAAAALKLPPRS